MIASCGALCVGAAGKAATVPAGPQEATTGNHWEWPQHAGRCASPAKCIYTNYWQKSPKYG
jgi:hypothetical protein